MRRVLLGLVAVTTIAASALAQDYPSRPIRMLQGFAPGGNADAIARLLTDEMAKGLNQTITVEAKPGAGGNLASAEVAKAAPDGYTMMVFTTGHVVSAAMYKQLPFDPINDFAYITTVSELPFLIVVNPAKSPYKTFAELVAAAKAKPGSLTVGTAGVGTGQHLATEMLASMIGSKVVHVPHRGDTGAITVLLSSPGSSLWCYGDGKCRSVRPAAGDVFFCPAHVTTAVRSEKAFECILLCLSPTLFSRVADDSGGVALDNTVPAIMRKDAFVQWVVTSLADEVGRAGRAWGELFASSLATALGVHLSRECAGMVFLTDSSW